MTVARPSTHSPRTPKRHPGAPSEAQAPRPSPVLARAAAPSRATVGASTGHEVHFDAEELLVSKTDLKGHITYANDAFLRVAAFSEAELVGQAHNVIRHPEMPRCVFALLWKSIQAGKEIFAYVVNFTKTGDHYWVLAHITPTFDSQGGVVGYHSNRRSADRAAIERIRALYSRLLSEERTHARPSDAIAAGSALLEQTLAEQNTTYDAFIFSL